MQKTFEHLLGLNTKTALALLAGYGITNVRVTLTGSPPLLRRAGADASPPEPDRVTALEAVFRNFSAGEGADGDDSAPPAFDPLTDPSLDEGMLVESRVVAVRDDGRQLLVARFHVGNPRQGGVRASKPAKADAPDGDAGNG